MTLSMNGKVHEPSHSGIIGTLSAARQASLVMNSTIVTSRSKQGLPGQYLVHLLSCRICQPCQLCLLGCQTPTDTRALAHTRAPWQIHESNCQEAPLSSMIDQNYDRARGQEHRQVNHHQGFCLPCSAHHAQETTNTSNRCRLESSRPYATQTSECFLLSASLSVPVDLLDLFVIAIGVLQRSGGKRGLVGSVMGHSSRPFRQFRRTGHVSETS